MYSYFVVTYERNSRCLYYFNMYLCFDNCLAPSLSSHEREDLMDRGGFAEAMAYESDRTVHSYRAIRPPEKQTCVKSNLGWVGLGFFWRRLRAAFGFN